MTRARNLTTARCPRCDQTVPLMSGTFEGRVQLDAHTVKDETRSDGRPLTYQCSGSFLLVADATDAARLFRTERAKVAAINGARDAIGAALVAQFPEAKSGDEAPEAINNLASAVQRVVDAWVEDNVPKPLTLAEAVAALIEARSALRAVSDAWERGDLAGRVRDADETAANIGDVLARAPMTEDDLPRP